MTIMKKILYYTIAMFILFTSCEELLDKPPVDEISNDQYWNTRTDLENYILQFYPRLYNFASNHCLYIGDEAYRGSDHLIVYTPEEQLNGNRTIVTTSTNWERPWEYIRSVNIFFENYQKALNNEILTNIKQFIGEAHFFKAWFYYDLLKMYGDVPWYTNSLQMDSEKLYKPRDSRTVVMDSILWHLDMAVENLNYLNDVNGGNNRLSKEAALIFKSRVALFEGTWQKYHAGTPFGTSGVDYNKYFQASVDAAEELMIPDKYDVEIYNTGDPDNDWGSNFNRNDLSSNKEIILWRRYDANLELTHNLPVSMLAHDEICITQQLINNYLNKDGTVYNYINVADTVKGIKFLSRIAADCDPRLAQIIDTPGAVVWTVGSIGYWEKPFFYESGTRLDITGYQCRKGLDVSVLDGSIGWNNTKETGVPILRYAEALLNYAEAKAELGQSIDYSISLDLLRSRAGMPDFAVISDPNRSTYGDYGYPLNDLLYEIRRERAVELALEGIRYYDWRRWRAHNLFLNKRPKGFPFLQSDYPDEPPLSLGVDSNGFLDPFKDILPNGYQFNANRDYLDCIPTNEITLNPQLDQNPGW